MKWHKHLNQLSELEVMFQFYLTNLICTFSAAVFTILRPDTHL